jgi:formylglycine-generating enzyme required for sulfatase activity
MGQRVGTPAYMSPEQAAGRLDQVGPASDVYSLGASLYTLLAGRPPVIGDDLAGLLARVERGEFSPPHEAQPWVDRALSAVCLKAMARRPEDRYGSPRTLAEDLERWLADEPVAAWREPRGRALRRWVLRHQAAVAAIVVALGAVLISTESYFTQRLVAARGRVEALESAEIRSVPELLLDLGPDRALVRNELRALADPEQADPGHRLRGNLALLPDEPARAEFLVRFVTDPRATPEDVLVIRQALLDRDLAGPAADRIIQALPGPDAPIDNAALRAFGTLAGLKPDWTGWPEYADPIARQLTHDELVWISTRAVVFEPIARRLTEPLRHIYADRSNPEARGLAFALLVEFALRETNPDQVEDLAALIPEASPQHASQLSEHFHHLTTDADRGRLIAALAPMLDVPARFDDPRAARQGRIAAVLAHLGAADRSWPLLRLDPDGDNDPAVRTELIHQFPAFGVAPELLVDRLLAEPDVSARRALVLSLGSYPDDALPDRRRDAITPTLLDWYRSDPDPGLHSAISWLLRRRWGLGGTIDALDRQLASTEPVDGRGWYVSRHGQLTFAVVRGPVEFRMGSTLQTDPDRNPDEAAHTRRIDRPFAIAAEEVTAADFASFLRNHPDLADHPGHSSIRQIPTGDCPAGAVSWYDAARFCNWASQLEGLPEGQWCYPEPIGPGMTLPDDHLERLGYRLPTEAEWEFACRAGTVTARPFGGPELRLDQYSWSIANASRVLHPVGSLKPNDLGLFDLIGNAFEWCGTPYAEAFPPAEGDSVPDRLPVAPYSDDVGRVLRGGAFTDTPPDLRSASRSWDRPGDRSPSYGFRLARTLPTAAP